MKSVVAIISLFAIISGIFASTIDYSSKGIPSDYQGFSAEAKRDFIWEEGILSSQFHKLPPFENIDILGLMFSPLKKKMTHSTDFSPVKWKKPIHRRAVVAKVKFIPEIDTPFTGFFAEESLGLLRASLTYKPDKRGVAPGFALKIFVNGGESLDISFLTGLDSHGQNYNFFARPFTNIVPLSNKFGGKFVSMIFKRVTKRTNYISIKHFANISPAGDMLVQSFEGPSQVFLKAPKKIHFAELPARDIREDLMTLEEGEVVLEMYARSNENKSDFDEITEVKNKKFLNNSIKIGNIILDSKFIASRFGDDQLFFKHSKVD